jgi:UDP:flavonoid glycosyltransferase YjiC (YdhE family)
VRILFSSTPEYSHLGPLVPLARELQTRGHEVLVACSPQLARWATRAGLRATACGLDLDPDHLNLGEAGIVLTVPDDLTPETQNSWATRAVFAEIFAPPMARDLRSIADEFQPDVMVRDRGEYAGWAVGTALDVPVVTVTFGRLADPGFDIDNAGDALKHLLGGPRPRRGRRLDESVRRPGSRASATVVRGAWHRSPSQRAVRTADGR